MSREEILTKLGSLSFQQVWSDSSWSDVGFTEKPIWVNSQGYGYYADDEPYQLFCLDLSQCLNWKGILEKIKAGKLDTDSILGTPLEILCNSIATIDEIDLGEFLGGLCKIKIDNQEIFYCAETFDNPMFFESRKQLVAWAEDRIVDVYWTNLNDDELETWEQRITNSAFNDDWIETIR